MALLNPSPSPVLPRTMWLSFRAGSAGMDPISIAPLALSAPSDRGHARVAAKAVEQLGLNELPEDEKTLAQSGYQQFLWFLRRAVMRPGGHEGEDLREALNWLALVPPTTQITRNNVQSLDSEGRFTNDTRWNTFRYWASDLGFAESAALIAGDSEALVSNPSRAILAAVTQQDWPWPAGQEIPVSDFMAAMQERLPVLPAFERDREADPLGQAVSWALLGLHHRRWIVLEGRSDSARTYLSDPDDSDGKRSVSHLVVGDGDE